MKIFIDSANISELKKAYSTGLVSGVTTNPSLIAKEGMQFEKLVNEILRIFTKPMDIINFESVSTEAGGMIEDGIKLSRISKNVVVKVPLTEQGLLACQELARKNIRVNVTLCFSSAQALLAAKSGAYFISPMVGRLDDQNDNGMRLVEEIRKIYTNYKFNTQILVASVRNVQHVTEAALIGADVCTVPYNVFEKLFMHELTDIGLARFLDDWKKAKLKIK